MTKNEIATELSRSAAAIKGYLEHQDRTTGSHSETLRRVLWRVRKALAGVEAHEPVIAKARRGIEEYRAAERAAREHGRDVSAFGHGSAALALELLLFEEARDPIGKAERESYAPVTREEHDDLAKRIASHEFPRPASFGDLAEAETRVAAELAKHPTCRHCGGPKAAHSVADGVCVCAMPDARPCGCPGYEPREKVGPGEVGIYVDGELASKGRVGELGFTLDADPPTRELLLVFDEGAVSLDLPPGPVTVVELSGLPDVSVEVTNSEGERVVVAPRLIPGFRLE